MSVPPTAACPACGAPTTGRFCAECGAAVVGAICAGCRSQLAPGARFCHRCGTAVGTAPAPASKANAALPWGVAAIAVLAFIAYAAGQRFGGTRAPSAPAQATGAPDAPAEGVVRAPDISQMSPREQADKLFDRVMRYASEGKPDSVQFFAPMAMSAIQRLAPLDPHLHYDYGLIAVVSGDEPAAVAQADTILRDNPTHLLGLILASRAAGMRSDQKAQADYDRRLIAADPAERAKGLEEYRDHQSDILNALAEARRRTTTPQ
jgi:double zinc ribbon protein